MTGTTTLHRVVSDTDRQVLARLWQLYAHDLSEFRGSMPDEAGLFKAGRLATYLGDDDRLCHLLRHDGAVAGFVLVRGVRTRPRVLGELYVVRAARRSGVGADAARQVMRAHPGRWEVAFQEANPAAARFWRGLADELASGRWREEQRPVPDKPDVPPDLWITLDVV